MTRGKTTRGEDWGTGKGYKDRTCSQLVEVCNQAMFTKGVAPQADLSTLRGSSGSDASPDLKVGKLYAYVEPRSHATKPKIAEEVCLSLVVCRKP